MRRKTVTLFNRHGDKWYATTFRNVYFSTDRSKIISMFGEQASDRAILHVWYKHNGIDAVASGKTYLQPIQYRNSSEPEKHFTFASGEDFDFFIEGDWDGASEIEDDAPEYGINGFYDWMNRQSDLVYAVTSCTRYDMLAHFEVSGR